MFAGWKSPCTNVFRGGIESTRARAFCLLDDLGRVVPALLGDVDPGVQAEPCVGQGPLLELRGVQLLEHLRHTRGILVRALGALGDGFAERECVDELVHDAEAVADTHHVEGERRGDAEDERLARGPLFLRDLLGRIGERVVHLEDLLGVEAIHPAVGTRADLLQAVEGYLAQPLAHVDDLGQAGHVEHLVHLG